MNERKLIIMMQEIIIQMIRNVLRFIIYIKLT